MRWAQLSLHTRQHLLSWLFLFSGFLSAGSWRSSAWHVSLAIPARLAASLCGDVSQSCWRQPPCKCRLPHGLPSPSRPGCLFRVPVAAAPPLRFIRRRPVYVGCPLEPSRGSYGLPVNEGRWPHTDPYTTPRQEFWWDRQGQGALAAQLEKCVNLGGWALARHRKRKLEETKIWNHRSTRVVGNGGWTGVRGSRGEPRGSAGRVASGDGVISVTRSQVLESRPVSCPSLCEPGKGCFPRFPGQCFPPRYNWVATVGCLEYINCISVRCTHCLWWQVTAPPVPSFPARTREARRGTEHPWVRGRPPEGLSLEGRRPGLLSACPPLSLTCFPSEPRGWHWPWRWGTAGQRRMVEVQKTNIRPMFWRSGLAAEGLGVVRTLSCLIVIVCLTTA